MITNDHIIIAKSVRKISQYLKKLEASV